MSAATWKAFERRVCRLFNAERRGQTGPGGWAQGSDDDGTAIFAIECKRCSRYQLRQAWIEQARRNAHATHRPWLLVLAEHNERRPLAVIDLHELVAICREAGRLEGD
jgi:hypothetical protein